MSVLPRRVAAFVFGAFAFAYFLSALIRGITATLAPTLTVEFALQARDLGLLGGAYFLGFSATQLPLGSWLDRHGPKRVLLGFLTLAVLGCLAFAVAGSFASLFAARMLCGIGVSACLMAPLTGYRRWLTPGDQMRANSWMLMTGSLGLIASTLPVQWLVPWIGWRLLFAALAILLALAMLAVAWQVPRWANADGESGPGTGPRTGYAQVWRHPTFRAMMPLGFFGYGGLVAIQTLWAAPWMVQVAGYSALEAATGMFWINVGMLLAFWAWGLAGPWLAHRGWHAGRLIVHGMPLAFVLLAANIGLTGWAPAWSGAMLAVFCISSSVITLSQPAIGMAFPPAMAGRALSAFNLVIFLGVFAVQWAIGLVVDALLTTGLTKPHAFQVAWTVFLACCVVCYAYFIRAGGHNRPT